MLFLNENYRCCVEGRVKQLKFFFFSHELSFKKSKSDEALQEDKNGLSFVYLLHARPTAGTHSYDGELKTNTPSI